LILEFTQKGYVRRSSPKSYQRRQARQNEAEAQEFQEFEDETLQVEAANTTHELLVLTRDGKAFTINISDIPTAQRQSKGVPLVNLLPSSAGAETEAIAAQLVLSEDVLTHDLILLTRQGRIKRVPLSEFQNLTGRGLTAVKLKKEDELAFITLAKAGEQLAIATSGGRLIRFAIDDDNLPIMGRTAQGPQALRLRKQESIVGCVRIQDQGDCVLMVSAAGFAKRLPVSGIHLGARGGIGTQAFLFKQKTDSLVAIVPGLAGGEITVMTSEPRSAQIPIDAIPRQGRDTLTAYRLGKLAKGERIETVTLTSLVDNDAEGENADDSEE
jgi:DNA gyrase subunit A